MRVARTSLLGLALAGALLATAGCTAEGPSPEPLPPTPPTEGCRAEQLGGYVGSKATDEVIATLQQWRGENPIRVLKPGSAMTMDYRPNRLNVYLDDAGVIREFKCN